jgi:hypothetical protein
MKVAPSVRTPDGAIRGIVDPFLASGADDRGSPLRIVDFALEAGVGDAAEKRRERTARPPRKRGGTGSQRP